MWSYYCSISTVTVDSLQLDFQLSKKIYRLYSLVICMTTRQLYYGLWKSQLHSCHTNKGKVLVADLNCIMPFQIGSSLTSFKQMFLQVLNELKLVRGFIISIFGLGDLTQTISFWYFCAFLLFTSFLEYFARHWAQPLTVTRPQLSFVLHIS